jgi:hypothetical protein
MSKKTFGSRSRPPSFSTAGGGSSNNKYSRVDFMRGLLAAIIKQYGMGPVAEKDSMEMRIRLLQDQLAELKRLSSARSHRSDDLAWVDIWRPRDPAQ